MSHYNKRGCGNPNFSEVNRSVTEAQAGHRCVSEGSLGDGALNLWDRTLPRVHSVGTELQGSSDPCVVRGEGPSNPLTGAFCVDGCYGGRRRNTVCEFFLKTKEQQETPELPEKETQSASRHNKHSCFNDREKNAGLPNTPASTPQAEEQELWRARWAGKVSPHCP